jgi:hypothetical protein
MRKLAERIAKNICVHPPVKGICLCSMRAGERCGVCMPPLLDEEAIANIILTELSNDEHS